MDKVRENIRRYMVAAERIDGIYERYSKIFGKNPSELCLLFALDCNESLSQKQICEEWMIPKTTLNTIIKKYQSLGYVELQSIKGKKREKHICLTEKGKEFAECYLDFIYRAENEAMSLVLAKYDEGFIEASEMFADRLKAAFEKQLKNIRGE